MTPFVRIRPPRTVSGSWISWIWTSRPFERSLGAIVEVWQFGGSGGGGDEDDIVDLVDAVARGANVFWIRQERSRVGVAART